MSVDFVRTKYIYGLTPWQTFRRSKPIFPMSWSKWAYCRTVRKISMALIYGHLGRSQHREDQLVVGLHSSFMIDGAHSVDIQRLSVI